MITDRTMWAIMCGIIILQVIGGIVCLWFGKSLLLNYESYIINGKDGKIFKKQENIKIKKKYSKILKNIGIINIILGALSPIISAFASIFIDKTPAPMLSIGIVLFSTIATLIYIVISLIITIINSNISIGYKVLLVTILLVLVIFQFFGRETIKMIIK